MMRLRNANQTESGKKSGDILGKAAQGLEVVIPNEQDVDVVNDVIFNELCMGKIKEESRKKFQRIIDELKQRGGQRVILGCTENGLLIHQSDSSLPVFDTTVIQAISAVEIALKV